MTKPKTPEEYMRLALVEARKSPPKPTNYCVGALLVSPSSSEPILATGYTLELPGNTHAEQCCFMKMAEKHDVSEGEIGRVLPEDTVLYTTMEPCNLRLSGNAPCVDRILGTHENGRGIKKVYVGVLEPEKFVGENQGRKKLEEAGVEVIQVLGMEDEILKTATSGHEK
ncbi:Diaminohydroxyphosphoribosylamino-pyrimidine deaminase [Sphaceloma murrayae]|uniref:Diaminohydroxyphosphoribosylamino-pyrimidine deaminase n=1 Tax=Sphaceloma murrayae TaxID=2082308 RepID=A0A2K1QZ19_9PEZI|nr:Diaminohydroxyphosphoribosylamino-pyrimidine deaminase [Sphaceloma murrayae]